jgi:hypothetical protein
MFKNSLAGAVPPTASTQKGASIIDATIIKLPDVADLLSDTGTLSVFRDYFPNFKKLKQIFKTEHSSRVNIYQHGSIYLVKDYAAKEFPDDKARNILQVIQLYHHCDFKEAATILAAKLGLTPTHPGAAPIRPVIRPKQTISPEPETTVIQVDPAHWQCVSVQDSNFHFYARSLGVSNEHLATWLVGAELKQDTVFTVFGLQNKAGELVNLKHFKYSATGSRDQKQNPFYLKNPKGKKYGQCLYGEHLLREGVPVVIVESEKTAVLGSFFYPQYDFVSTGGATALSSKIHALQGKKGYVLHDADSTGRKLSTYKLLQQAGLEFVPVDLFKARTDGYDLADALRDGLRPDLSNWQYQVKPDLTGPDFVLHVNQFIGEQANILTDYIQAHHKVVLSARTGTGKTTFALNDLAPRVPGRLVILEPLTVIADAIAQHKYGEAAIIKQGATKEDIQVAINSKITVCTYDSFSKIDQLDANDLLIIDEVHALLSGYNMPDKRGKYEHVFKRLKEVKNVLCISATPPDIFAPYGFKTVKVEPATSNHITITPKIYKGKIQHELIKVLPTLNYKEKQYLIRLNNLNLIDRILQSFKDLEPEQIAVLSSDTKAGEVYQEITKSKIIPKQVRLVFTTSLIDCGVDVYNPDLEIIIAEHQNEYLSTQDTLQFLARPRKVSNLKATVYKQDRTGKAISRDQLYKDAYELATSECSWLNQMNAKHTAGSPLVANRTTFSDTAHYCKYNHQTEQYEPNELLIHYQVEQSLIRCMATETYFAQLEQEQHITIEHPEHLIIAKTPETIALDKAAKAEKETIQEQTLQLLEDNHPADVFSALYHSAKDLDTRTEIIKAGYDTILTDQAKEVQQTYQHLLTDRAALLIFNTYLKLQRRDQAPEVIPTIIREHNTPRKLGDLFTRLDILHNFSHYNELTIKDKRDADRLLQHYHTLKNEVTELTSINNKTANRVTADEVTALINQDRHKAIRLSKDKAMQLFRIFFQVDTLPIKVNRKTVKYFTITSDNVAPLLGLSMAA